MWLALRQGLTQIAIGLMLSLLAAFGVSRVLASLFVNVTPTGLLTFISITTYSQP
jgi:hypothetical protein